MGRGYIVEIVIQEGGRIEMTEVRKSLFVYVAVFLQNIKILSIFSIFLACDRGNNFWPSSLQVSMAVINTIYHH